MTNAAEIFIRYTEEVLAVARRLLSRGVTVHAHECSSVHFGSWSVVAGVEQERFQFCWDGRTLVLTISQSVRLQGRRDWEPLHTLNVRHPEAVSMMEMFLLERFAAQH